MLTVAPSSRFKVPSVLRDAIPRTLTVLAVVSIFKVAFLPTVMLPALEELLLSNLITLWPSSVANLEPVIKLPVILPVILTLALSAI